MRRATLGAFLWVAAQAGCAAHGRLGVDPAGLAVSPGADEGPVGAFVAQVARDVCEVGEAAAAARRSGSAELVEAVDSLTNIADRACAAGLQSIPVEVDEFGIPALGDVPGGVRRGTDGRTLVFSEPEVLELWSGSSATGGDACSLSADAMPVAVVEMVGESWARVTVEGEGATLWAVPSDGDPGSCAIPEGATASLGLPGQSGVWTVYADSTASRGAPLVVTLSEHAGGGAAYEWRAGTPLSLPLILGGYVDSASAIGSWCTGYIPSDPQFQIRIPASQYGSVMVTTDGDAVIVARSPEGIVTCNDDYVGLNPGLDQWFDAGVWEIWVGTYGMSTSLTGSIDFY